MMTEMTRYKQQTNLDDDNSSVGSARTEELPTGTTQIHYHMGSHWWKSRTSLEKALLVGWFLLLLVVTVLVALLHLHSEAPKLMVHTVLHPSGISSDSSLVNKDTCMSRDCVMIAGDVLSSMDPLIDPCEDFYQYACGGWIGKNPIPEGKPIWGTLNKLSSDNQIIMRQALESTEKAHCESERKARIFYRSCMDVNQTIEHLGPKPLQDLIKKAGGWSVKERWKPPVNYSILNDLIITKIEYGSSALFSWGVEADDKNSTRHILQFDQGGLTLPARNYYLNESEKAVQNAYVDYISKIVVLLGGSKKIGDEVANDVMEVEKEIAEITMPDDERREDDKLYHLSTLYNLTNMAPFMDWTKFVKTAFQKINKPIDESEEIVVYAPSFLQNLTDIINNYNSTTEGQIKLHNYVMWHMTKNYVGFLSRDFRDAVKSLEKAQMGVVGSEDIWRECVASTDAALGPALGAMFIRKAFKGHSKDLAQDMITRIRKSFIESLASVPWMDQTTKKAAIDKATAIYEMIGYPDYILDPTELDNKFDELPIKENEFFANNVRVNTFSIKDHLKRLSKQVNKTRWDMTPPTVNAYYSPTKNDIVFPAGILQAPLFNFQNPKSLNYGAVGVVMGHELAHAFDDQGRRYDKDGNLRTWWQKETKDQFTNLTKCMVDQYSNYSLRGEHLNGKLTLGENIADNGGLKASYRAYQEYVSENGPEPALPGISLNHNQLFFLGFAQVWCSSITKEAAHLEIMKDSHVPGEFRVLGPLSNSKDFNDLFKCHPGAGMNPANKCVVW